MSDCAKSLIARWRTGDQQAATELFHHYAARLIALVRSRLSSKLLGHLEPEDIVQAAYCSFFIDTRDGLYEPGTAGDLWQLLVTITLHKLNDQVKRHFAGKRVVTRQKNYGNEAGLVRLQAHQCAGTSLPVEDVALAEQMERITARLSPSHRLVLERRLHGYTLDEIATEANCSQRTVVRVLDRIKAMLAETPFSTQNVDRSRTSA